MVNFITGFILGAILAVIVLSAIAVMSDHDDDELCSAPARLIHGYNDDWYECSACHQTIFYRNPYCPGCGKRIIWGINPDTAKDMTSGGKENASDR